MAEPAPKRAKGDITAQTHLYTDLKNNGQIAITYCDYDNGSFEKIAGITDPTGQVLGLMPHPEAALDSSLYPAGYIQDLQIPSTLFKNAIQFAQENLP
jgi:phosphoribosylformylglycinamidine synthase